MKANELMINDWVQDTNCTTPSKVAGLTQGKVYTWWADNTKHAKDEVYFEPVPLTAELLQQNGWRVAGYYGRQFVHADALFWLYRLAEYEWEVTVDVSDTDNDGYGHCTFATINSVHELQHALRLCGRDDLADNFKI